MSKIFTRAFRARYSEIGSNGYVEPAHFLRYLIETATDWGAANQLGIEDSERIGLAWVIRETEIHFYRPFTFNQVCDFTIWLEEWRRVRGKRSFAARLQGSGELLARGVQQVVSLDALSLRPITPPEEFMQRFRLEDPEIFDARPSLKAPQTDRAPFRLRRNVAWRDLDVMQHVNNAVYLDYAVEALTSYLVSVQAFPADLSPQPGVWLEFAHLKYLAPALWGDTLEIAVTPLNGEARQGEAFLSIINNDREETACQAQVGWRI